LPPPSWRDRAGELRDWRDRLSTGAAAAGVLIAVLAAAVVFMALRGGQLGGGGGGDVSLSLPRADSASSSGGDALPSATATTAGGLLHVHAAGAVVSPGVVTVPAGSRVADVVAAAGGAAADADLDQVNLAALVSDAERVYIPHKGEAGAALANSSVGGGAAGAAADGIVNINQADEATLETLPGVGPATAQAIIDYRTEHGRFKSVDDLLNVRGIGPSKLSQIKPHARV
jgi:competence protein ComEA